MSFFRIFLILGKSQVWFENCPTVSPSSAKTKYLDCTPSDAGIPRSRFFPLNAAGETVLSSYRDLMVEISSSSDILYHLKKIT